MKKPETYLKEYCQKLSDENLKWLYSRLSQRLGGDLAEATENLSSSKEIDRWFLTAESPFDLYDMLDTVERVAAKEFEKRNIQ